MNDTESQIGQRYDLLRQDWIGYLARDGSRAETGIEGLLAHAHEITEVVDPSPLVEASVVRLLVAVLLSSTRLGDEEDWDELWRRGRFDDDLLAGVRAACAGRFDLFDAHVPFYQSGDIEPRGEGERSKSVGYLFPEAATGTAVVHYAHAGERAQAACAACCAKGLVMLPVFATSGGQGIKPSINGVPPTYVLPLGATLFETLMLNAPLGDFRPPGAAPHDPGPFWAGDGVVGHKEERSDVGFLESLTWQPRRVRLLGPAEAGVCTRCGRPSDQLTRRVVLDQGRSRPKKAGVWLDPWAAYVRRTDRAGIESTRPLRPREERATWRDLGALFAARVPAAEVDARGRPSRPAIVNQMAHLRAELAEDAPAALGSEGFLTVGIRTDMKAKVFEWRRDRFELPRAALKAGAAVPLTRALRAAETAAQALETALLRLHAGTERPSPSWPDIRAAMADTTRLAARRYWATLEPRFRDHLWDVRLARDEVSQAAWLSDAMATVRSTVVQAHEEMLAGGDDTAVGLRRQEAARGTLYDQLSKGGFA